VHDKNLHTMDFAGHSEKKYLGNPYNSLNHGRLILFSFLAWPSSSFSLFASVVILRPACPREKPTEGNEGNEESKDRCFGVLEEFCRAPHREHRDNAGPTWQGSLGARTAMSARFWLQIKFTRTRLSALLFARCLNRSRCIPLKSETSAVSRSPDTQGCFFEGISSVEENCRAP